MPEDIIVIKKTSKGYQVKSEKGKNMSKPNLTKEQAKKRLQMIEMFKNMKMGIGA